MNMTPHRKYSYSRVSDGMGGFTKTLSNPVVIYGAVELWENVASMIVNRVSSVVPEDVLLLKESIYAEFEGQYEVKQVLSMGASRYKRLVLEKVDKPTHPLESEDES